MALLIVLFAPSQASEGGGAITGIAVNGTTSQTPLPDAEVILRASQDSAFVPLAETKTDGQGRFAFHGLSLRAGVIYLPGVNRAGVHYPGPRLQLHANKPAAEVKLVAFDAVQSPSPLICRLHDIAVQRGQGFLQITESLVIDNPSLTAFVGPQDGEAPTVTLRLSLPSGFDKVTFDREFHGRNFEILDGRLTTDLPWPPGKREFQFTYRLPVEQRHCVFARVLDLPTDRAVVRVTGSDAGAIACNLPSDSKLVAETTFANRGEALTAGYQIELQLGAIPIRFESYARWIAVGLLFTLVGASVAMRAPLGRPKRDRLTVPWRPSR